MFGIPEWALGVGFIIIIASVLKALRRGTTERVVDRVRGRKASRRDLAQVIDDMRGKLGDTEDLQRRLSDLEDVQRRLSEVEERLDFAERMLTKQREPDRLPADRK